MILEGKCFSPDHDYSWLYHHIFCVRSGIFRKFFPTEHCTSMALYGFVGSGALASRGRASLPLGPRSYPNIIRASQCRSESCLRYTIAPTMHQLVYLCIEYSRSCSVSVGWVLIPRFKPSKQQSTAHNTKPTRTDPRKIRSVNHRSLAVDCPRTEFFLGRLDTSAFVTSQAMDGLMLPLDRPWPIHAFVKHCIHSFFRFYGSSQEG